MKKYQNKIFFILFITVSLGVLGIKYLISYKIEQKDILPGSIPIVGIWEWRSIQSDEPFIFLDHHGNDGFNVIYLDISNYVEFPQKETNQRISEYIKKAQDNGIDVQALAGSPLWTQSSHKYMIDRVLAFVEEWNNSQYPPFSGLQFDIEPYNLEVFKQNPELVMIRYLDVFADIIERIKNIQNNNRLSQKFELGIAIPAWFDDFNNKLKDIDWGGERKSVFKHLVKIINSATQPYFAVMAYSNSVYGYEGSAEMAKYEIKFTSDYAPKIKIIIGQEVNALPSESYQAKQALLNAINELIKSFYSYQTFSGITINDAEKYERLK